MHKVFESFKGSMLVSILMGLVEDDTVYAFHVNAEHPYTILYRDGKAEFIEKSSLLQTGKRSICRVLFLYRLSNVARDIIISKSDGER